MRGSTRAITGLTTIGAPRSVRPGGPRRRQTCRRTRLRLRRRRCASGPITPRSSTWSRAPLRSATISAAAPARAAAGTARVEGIGSATTWTAARARRLRATAYADPPFNTARSAARSPRPRPTATATGFGGRRYASTLLETSSYRDAFDDYLGFLEPRLRELRRVLHPTGTLYLHLDYREAHHVKLLLDELFGRECFLNELIWAYDYGGKPQAPLAAEARHDPRLRQGPGALLLRRRGGRARALHGARPRHAREGGAREDAGQRHLAHDRLPHRPREDRLPDAEARGARPPLRARLLAAGRPRAGPVRRLGHARRGRRGDRPPLPADRREPRRRAGDAASGSVA